MIWILAYIVIGVVISVLIRCNTLMEHMVTIALWPVSIIGALIIGLADMREG